MAHMSVPCHKGPPATKGHFSSEPAVAGRGRYYCSTLTNVGERSFALCRNIKNNHKSGSFWSSKLGDQSF